MIATAEQLELAAPPDPARCPRCGRRWPGVFVARGMDVAELLTLDAETFRAVVRCWIGACGEGDRT